MAAVEVTITGVLYDKLARTSQNVVLIGEATLTGLGVGGGPLPGGGGPVDPGYGRPEGGRPEHPIFYPPGTRPHPEHPIYNPPSIWPDPGRPHPEHPIVLPPDQVPPDMQPPTPPPAGTTTPVPPPAGSSGWPVQPQVVPEYVVLNYPGVGPIYVTPPVQPGH